MSDYLLDTDVLIDWLRGYEPTLRWLKDQIRSGAELRISLITVAEVFAGTSVDARDARSELLNAFRFVACSYDAARLAGEMKYDHQRNGITIALPDLLQAAVARISGLTVATSNASHFPDIKTVNPRVYEA